MFLNTRRSLERKEQLSKIEKNVLECKHFEEHVPLVPND